MTNKPVILLPSLETKKLDAGTAPTLAMGYSRAAVRKSNAPEQLRQAHLNVCGACQGEVYTAYRGQDVSFICERCWGDK